MISIKINPSFYSQKNTGAEKIEKFEKSDKIEKNLTKTNHCR